MDRKNVDQVYVPDGAPAWVTRETIVATIELFQPYYPERITPEVALGMALAMAGSLDGWRYS